MESSWVELIEISSSIAIIAVGGAANAAQISELVAAVVLVMPVVVLLEVLVVVTKPNIWNHYWTNTSYLCDTKCEGIFSSLFISVTIEGNEFVILAVRVSLITFGNRKFKMQKREKEFFSLHLNE